MGGVNHIYFLGKFSKQFHPRILEVGSKNYGSTMPFREALSWDSYVGLDMAEGEGVDVVGNMEEGLCGLEPASFDLIICCSVLEHTRKPWVVAENISKLLAPQGTAYISVPWIWRYHGYPDDYWRISFSGLKLIFPDLEFGDMYYSTYQEAHFWEAAPGWEDTQCRWEKNKDGTAKEKLVPYAELHALGRRKVEPSRLHVIQDRAG